MNSFFLFFEFVLKKKLISKVEFYLIYLLVISSAFFDLFSVFSVSLLISPAPSLFSFKFSISDPYFLVGSLFLMAAALRMFGEFFINRFVFTLEKNLSIEIVGQFMRKKTAFDDCGEADIHRIALTESAYIANRLFNSLFRIVAAVVLFLFSIATAFFIAGSTVGWSVIVCLLILSPFSISLFKYAIRLSDKRVRSNKKRFRSLYDFLKIKDILAIGGKDVHLGAEFSEALNVFKWSQIWFKFLNSVPKPMFEIGLGLLLCFVGPIVAASELAGGTLIVGGILILFRLLPALQSCLTSISSLLSARSSIQQFLDLSGKLEKRDSFSDFNRLSSDCPDSIEIQQFVVGDDSEITIGDGVGVKIEKNEMVCLMGPSGIGKSTFLRALAGITSYASISVRAFFGLDNEVYRKGLPSNLVSYLPQQDILWNGTIKDNLMIDSLGTDEKSLLTWFNQIRFFHNKEFRSDDLALHVGDHGSKLSGGQQRKLCLLRVLLLNRPIVLLDEVTSSLDPVSEKEVCSFLNSVSQGKIVVVTTHGPMISKHSNRCYNLN
tara:strand:+ start:219 stop:1862 length:1644 start_codon:yes stop_codon:yes gene_type:complete